jgi:hypothetical protein
VPSRETIPEGITRLGIKPRVQYNAQMISYHRLDGDFDHFMFVSSHPSTYAVSRSTVVTGVDADVLIPRRSRNSIPLWMDLWSGETTPIAKYEEVSDDYIKVRVTLKPYQACMITVAPLTQAPVHAVTSDATKIVREEYGLFLRANTTGSYTTTLSNGESVTTVVDSVPASIELKNWTLDVDDWQPTADIYSPDTIIVKHHLSLNNLTAWSNIPELLDGSGVGTYKSTFELGNWPEHTGAILSFTPFEGSFRLKVNGKQLPAVDQLDVNFDIGKYLKSGTNELEVEVATTIINRLRVVNAPIYGVAARQAYGLVAPVTLRPYVAKKLAA